jgi:hypothetical protein
MNATQRFKLANSLTDNVTCLLARAEGIMEACQKHGEVNLTDVQLIYGLVASARNACADVRTEILDSVKE